MAQYGRALLLVGLDDLFKVLHVLHFGRICIEQAGLVRTVCGTRAVGLWSDAKHFFEGKRVIFRVLPTEGCGNVYDLFLAQHLGGDDHLAADQTVLQGGVIGLFEHLADVAVRISRSLYDLVHRIADVVKARQMQIEIAQP